MGKIESGERRGKIRKNVEQKVSGIQRSKDDRIDLVKGSRCSTSGLVENVWLIFINHYRENGVNQAPSPRCLGKHNLAVFI